jgi:hypothetical protein
MNIQSMAAARRRVREAQAKAQQQRARREAANVEDMATFLVARGRLAGVDRWEAERVSQVGAEASRRRDEHRLAAAAALVRMRARGETASAIAELAETTETEVRAYLKLARINGAAGRARSSASPAAGSSESPPAMSGGSPISSLAPAEGS